MEKRGLKVNAEKSKMMVLGEEKELECEICLDRLRFEQLSEFKYLGCGFDKSGTDVAECRRKVASGRKFAGTIRSLVNPRDLQLDCARKLH